ncbi:S-layer homology domain-containing protein [Paenibacillus sp. LjRoot56]
MIIRGIGKDLFNPDADITRAEVAKLVQKLLRISDLL